MRKLYKIFTFTLCVMFILTACAPAAATQAPVPPTAEPATAVPPTAVPPTEVPPTEAPTENPVCLTIGATYGGPITDAGYNQAMHEAVAEIKEEHRLCKYHRS